MVYYLKIGDTPVICNSKEKKNLLVKTGYIEISKAEFDRLMDPYYQKVKENFQVVTWGV